ncbi:hypothetical protein VCR31J2_1270528 [Vibrio coralliirubri]|uniref:Uncharacterized protein n=1 Tax=Vibrio coralliirubri TaxID=1516159 RepID=A0AA86WNS5_9VIBR|nr:hypothetical protein VCR31J2_1270528 [Vibrio coralliirubri]
MLVMRDRVLCDGGSAFLEREIHCKNLVEISGYKAEGIMRAVWLVRGEVGSIIGW